MRTVAHGNTCSYTAWVPGPDYVNNWGSDGVYYELHVLPTTHHHPTHMYTHTHLLMRVCGGGGGGAWYAVATNLTNTARKVPKASPTLVAGWWLWVVANRRYAHSKDTGVDFDAMDEPANLAYNDAHKARAPQPSIYHLPPTPPYTHTHAIHIHTHTHTHTHTQNNPAQTALHGESRARWCALGCARPPHGVVGCALCSS